MTKLERHVESVIAGWDKGGMTPADLSVEDVEALMELNQQLEDDVQSLKQTVDFYRSMRMY